MNSIHDSIDFVSRSADFVEVTGGSRFKIDIRYASKNNFVGENMYGSFCRAFVHQITAQKLMLASEHLLKNHPDHRFIIFDALRPRSIQRVLWQHVLGTLGEKYIANPDLGSLHNFGFAVDLSVLNPAGVELDMGAGFDDFREIAQPQLELKFLTEGLLTQTHITNRRILRGAMESGGFIQLPHEWWHFDALPKAEVRARFKIVE